MDNQHKQITGYRDLSQDEIDTMNIIKELGAQIETQVDSLAATPGLDQRWVAIGKTHMQQGLMALVRAVAQPTTF